MRHIVLISLAMLTLTGCVTDRRDAARTYVTAEGYERMSRAVTLTAKRDAARAACIESGLPQGTRRHARCIAGYFQFDAEIARAHAAEMRDRAARTGTCVDAERLTARRCLEI